MHRRELPRRAVLRLGTGALLTACLPGKRRARQPVPASPDIGVAASVRADEESLIAAYDATLLRFPALASRLQTLREQHTEHLTALRGGFGRSAGPSVGGSPSVGPTATADLGPAVPADASSAVRALLAAERAAAAARVADCLAASPQLAPLLASIGASEAAHGSVLAGMRPPI